MNLTNSSLLMKASAAVALTAAIAGTSYAAKVTSSDIKNGTIKSADIKDRAIDASKIAEDTITAAEIAGLDLSNTGLVVLSACDSGIGDLVGGQGVIGLRRGFTTAGVQALVTTLWAIPDGPTAALMDRLYAHYLAKEPVSAAVALHAAQRDQLAAQRAAGAVRHNEWAGFVVSGPPNLRY